MTKKTILLGCGLALSLGASSAFAQTAAPIREQARDRSHTPDATKAQDRVADQRQKKDVTQTRDKLQEQDRDRVADQTQKKDVAQTRDKVQEQDRDRLADQTQTLTQDQVKQRDQLRDQIHKQASLSAQDQQALAQPLDHYVANGGNSEQLRATIGAALDSGCRGVCLSEVVRSLNRAQHHGLDATAAHAAVGDTLRQLKQERDRLHQSAPDTQNRDQLRTRIGDRLAERARDRQAERRLDRMQERRQQGPHGQGQGRGEGRRGGQ
jgi:hypothetical protein